LQQANYPTSPYKELAEEAEAQEESGRQGVPPFF
jgi:hypothetical protein